MSSNKFKNLFGLDETHVQKTCVLLPFLPKNILKNLKIDQLTQGKIYATGNNDNFTVIHTRIGASLCGDAVLYLKETKCENIIFLGTCGLTNKTDTLNIGSILCPESCLAMESFSQALTGQLPPDTYSHADKNFLNEFCNTANHQAPTIYKTKGVSFGSLKLEEHYIDYLKERNIEVVDMEGSALFTAATHIQRKAIAIMVVTDILNEKPFYNPITPTDQTIINTALKKSAEMISYLFL